MTVTAENLKTWNTGRVVDTYKTEYLQKAEVFILLKYYNNIWNKRILDIGCGAGRTTFFLKDIASDYVGIDYSSKMIEFCKDKYCDVDFCVCDVRNMRVFNDSGFDFIFFSFNGIDYIPHEDREVAFGEIKRVLKSEGLFVFSSHNKNYKNATSEPKLEFSLNPYNQLKKMKSFVVSVKNHRKRRNDQEIHENYAIINDMAHNYSLLTYYIAKDYQISRLNGLGIKTIDVMDYCGKSIGDNDVGLDSPWLYYVCKKA